MPNPNTAVFPAAIATDTNLPPGTDLYQTSLTAGITNVQLTVPVAAVPSNFPCVITIDNEEILVSSTIGLNLQVTTRAFNGTVAASHLVGAVVSGNLVSWHINQIEAEIKAIETFIGAGGVSVFPGQASTVLGTITGSINGINTTFTFSPVINPVTISVYLNGLKMTAGGVDYNFVSGANTFTFVAGQTPGLGDTIVVDYFV